MKFNENCDKWVDKYRPQVLDDVILSDDIKTYFKSMLKSKKFINMTLNGNPGIGKTTIAKALALEANAEVLFLNCASGDGKIEAIQTKILPFTQSMPFDDRPMFVIFDELDSASSSGDSNFQKALRNVIEGSPNVVFIATCNYINKIISPVLSRCPEIKLNFNAKDLLVRIKDILDNEQISYDNNDLKEFVKVTIKNFYPDIRLIINHLQASCSTGKLIVSKSVIIDDDKKNFVEELVNKCISERNILNVRKFYIQNKEKIDDYKTFSSKIFNYVIDNNLVNNECILALADIYYKLNVVVDPEIQFFAMLTLILQSKQ